MKIKNKKSLILGATFGSSLGIAIGLTPLLLKDFEKSEVIKVQEFRSSNVFKNGATIDFKLDNESMSENVYENLKNNPDLNINILEHFSQKIYDTQKIKFDENKKSYSVDLKNLEAGKIYTFQILDLNRVNYIFDIHQNSSFIITKPEVKTINYQFNQKQVDIKMLFADEGQELNDQEVEITIKKASDPNVILTTKAKITLTEEVDQLSNKHNVTSLTAKFENLERNTDYYIDKITTSTDVIAINKNAKSEFRTAIARTELQKINVVSRNETSTTLDLYWNNEDQDVENKFINIYYAQREKNSDGSYSYKNLNVLNKVQITKVIENNLNNEVETYKTTVNIDNLIPGTSYEIIKTSSLGNLENSEIVQAVVPQNIQDQWVFSTRAVVESIKVDTEVEKSAFITVKFKDDLATENNQTIYLKYKAENESNDQIKTVSELAVGNFARFNLTGLQGLVNYSILEIGKLENLDNKSTTSFLYKDTFDENQKHFVPIIYDTLDALITNIEFDRNSIGETSIKAIVDFDSSKQFLVGRKARINFSKLINNQLETYPNNENPNKQEGIEIKNENGRIFAEFLIDNLQGGTTYVVNEVFLDKDPSKNVAENNLKLKFSSNINGEKRRFTTKGILDNIYFETNSDNNVSYLFLGFKNSFPNSDALSFERKNVTVELVDIDNPNEKPYQLNATILNNSIYFHFDFVETRDRHFSDLFPNFYLLPINKVYKIKSVIIKNYNTSKNDGELLNVSPLIFVEKIRVFNSKSKAIVSEVISNPITTSQSSLSIQFANQNNQDKFRKIMEDINKNEDKYPQFAPNYYEWRENKYPNIYFDSAFVNNSTLTLKYRKLGSSIVSSDVKNEIINEQSTASFTFDNLEIGTKYIIDSLEIKNDKTNSVTQIFYNDLMVSEKDKIFTTKNGIKSLEFSNIEQQKVRVIINLADATNEYDEKEFKLTYKSITDAGEQEFTVDSIPNIHGRLILDLINLNPKTKYKIEKVEMFNKQSSLYENVPFSNLINENDKEFTTLN
ncbi:fibronectin type III domain-containing protein [Mesomycoplasma lagogenitalium]|uniref:Fibronectin type III domain-containing protein n=1 Tax=Mesomycoplasma lagogenitalium TaxID=171286 RepID=A0ABY8LV21_9BACT|nr:fibronectin type III domain-containing protein [Mesomycoplasma lagogenitalium]WGI36286.1 fibronectin type III domain-containing protein [Mesomycoplasma lagogenitalium]